MMERVRSNNKFPLNDTIFPYSSSLRQKSYGRKKVERMTCNADQEVIK